MCGPGRTLLLYDRYLLSHDVHVYPLQHGGHEQNEGEEPENGECVGVEAIVIGHIITPRLFSLVSDKRAHSCNKRKVKCQVEKGGCETRDLQNESHLET